MGPFELDVLDDGTLPFRARAVFANVPESSWRQEVPVDRQGKIPVGHNDAVLKTDSDLIVMDTGYGTTRTRAAPVTGSRNSSARATGSR